MKKIKAFLERINKINIMKKYIQYLLGISLLLLFLGINGCRKHDTVANNEQENGSLSANDVDSLKFYIWHMNISDSSKPIPGLKDMIWGWAPMYYWVDQVPKDLKWYDDKFNGSSLLETGSRLMGTIASYSPKLNGVPKDKYSFIDVKGTVSSELEGGRKGGYGYMVGAAMDQNAKIHLFIEYSYKESDAFKKGLKRGDEIIAINNKTNMNLNDSAASDRINHALFQSESVSLKLKRPDQTVYSAQLSISDFHLNPVLFHDIYTVDGKKVGYFVFNSFVSVSPDAPNGADAKAEIDTVFAKFQDAGVDELIVDLRYNGGGAVVTTEFLDNLIAPASTVGKEMYNYEYNDQVTSLFKNNDNLKNLITPIKFESVGHNLDLKRVFFVTSGGTASAAELTINNLKPYMDVEIVGDTTYGKPVGFFTIPISFVTEDKGYQHVADMYSINFKSINSNGISDYFEGMIPNVLYHDYVDVRWGRNDPILGSIFSKIKTGNYISENDFLNQPNARKAGSGVRSYLRKSRRAKLKTPHQFNGMVDFERSRLLENF